MLKRSMLACALMAAAEVATSTGSAPAAAAAPAPAPAGTVPTSNDAGLAAPTEAKKRAPKDPANILNIINGRLPLPLVFMIRFQESGTNGEIAKKHGTSVGKVFDIKKGRNFGYIDKDYKPSAEEVAAAKAWCETGKTAKGQSLKEAGGNPEAILAALEKMGVASAEDVAKRNWNIRQVGASNAAGGQAPTAGSTGAAPTPQAGQTQAAAEKPAGAKLF